MKKTLTASIVLLMIASAPARETVLSTFKSPDDRNVVTVCRDEGNGTVHYRMTRSGKPFIGNSSLGMTTSDGDFTRNLKLTQQSERTINERYRMLSGRSGTANNHCNEKTLTFKADNGSGGEVDVIIRAYDDGIAFRYFFKGGETSSFIVRSDHSQIALDGFERCWGQSWTYDYSLGMGAEFDWDAARSMPNEKDKRLPLGCFAAPLLVETGKGEDSYCLITDAGVDSWFSRSIPHAESTSGKFGFVLRGTKNDGLEVTTKRPLLTPWRCAIVGRLTEIAVSDMTTNCSDATVADPSGQYWKWVKPGYSSWDWGGQQSGELKKRTDYDLAKEYIDFAANMGWQYFMLDEGWKSSKESTTGSSEGYVKGICNYAKGKGIGVHIWDASGAMTGGESGYEKTFKQWRDWGCVGVKIDFFYDGDTRGVMEKQEMLARAAARNQLMINFHGAPTPTGLSRKYPNIIAYEAVDGNEDYFTGGWNKTGTDPGYNGLLTLLRNVVGPMDYTICEFRNGLKGDGAIRNNTSWAQQLAHMVTMECGVQYIADHPKNIYNNATLRAAMKNVPAAWDESKCLMATIGPKGMKDIQGGDDVDCTVLWARRKGANWFVGATTNAGKTITIDCSRFLGEGTYKATIYKDGSRAMAEGVSKHADDIATEIRTGVGRKTKIDVALAQYGGCFVRFDAAGSNPD
ncbi:MAG: glycoside hydrolase family 97 catalytic domain-containing protein [Verrucomicrobiota bacterium]